MPTMPARSELVDAIGFLWQSLEKGHAQQIELCPLKKRVTSLAIVNFLFWNLKERPITDLVCSLCANRQVDVAVFAECGVPPSEFAERISNLTGITYRVTDSQSHRLVVLVNESAVECSEFYVNATGRLSLKSVQAGSVRFVLAVVHLKSEVGWNESELSDEACAVADDLRSALALRPKSGLCVVGDFNMQPFERGMVVHKGFFSFMARSSLSAELRTIQGREYRPLYNPMWGCFGDRTPGPAGTFFRRDASPVCYDWHIVDQVLFSAELLPFLANLGEIVERVGDVSLIDRNDRPSNFGSDHLPIMFTLDVPDSLAELV
jgi:hypothetical protein